jgi:hypothetical protein
VHGPNESYRRSYQAHVAWVVSRSDYRRCDVFHVTQKLHADDVTRLGLDADGSRKVLSALTPRLRKRLQRLDADAEAFVSMSPRPSDGQWHLHILLLSKRASVEDVLDLFELAGTDAEVTTPRSREEKKRRDGDHEAPMSAEGFGALISWYLFENRVRGARQGAQGRFSAWGQGVGYMSKAAVARRREYAQQQSDSRERRDGSRAQCPCTKNPTAGSGRDAEDADADAETGGDLTVWVGGGAVRSRAGYVRRVMSALIRRRHTDVIVQGMGRCRLLWAEVGNEGGIICYVRPLELPDDDQKRIPWRMIDAAGVPPILRTETEPMDADTDTDADESRDDVAQRYFDEAKHSRVSYVRPDGTRYVRYTNHATGETRETVQPPRDRA